MGKRLLVIGGVAAGPKAAAKAKRCDPRVEIVIYQGEEEISYAGCGLPYFISGVIKERDDLISRTPGKFAQDGIKVQKNRQIKEMDVNPVVALNLAHGFTQPLPREGWLSNQCRHPDQSKSDLWKLSSKGYKQPFNGGMQLIQSHLYATAGLRIEGFQG